METKQRTQEHSLPIPFDIYSTKITKFTSAPSTSKSFIDFSQAPSRKIAENFYQIPVLPQDSQNLCGFHTLYNMILVINSSPPSLFHSLDAFHSFYSATVDFLASRYPNQAEIYQVVSGDALERSHLEFINSHFSHFSPLLLESGKKCANGTSSSLNGGIYQFNYGLGFIELTQENIEAIERAGSAYRVSEDCLICFELGVTTHWSLLVFEKKKGKEEIKFYDSMNYNIPLIYKGDIEGALNCKETVRGGASEIEWDRSLRKSYFSDLKWSIDAISQVTLCFTVPFQLLLSR